MSLGTDIDDDGVSVIIPRNTAYPCERVKKYKTTEDNQPFMVIKVLQGEEEQASKCHEIAEYKININSQEPAGSHKIQVTFKVDENGLLTVTASSVNNQEIREEFKIDKIALSLDPSEIQKLVHIA